MDYIWSHRLEQRFDIFFTQAKSTFVDLSVYTANRNMRLFLSSKYGKQARLRPTDRSVPQSMSEKQLFYSALISNVHPHARLLELATQPAIQSMNQQPRANSKSEAHVGGSPYPLLDSFILGHCKRMCPSGGEPCIHSWLATERDGKTWVMFNMRGNRFCAKVDREHSRSNVGYVVDIKQGTFHQTCFSNTCRGFKSPANPLPRDVWAAYK